MVRTALPPSSPGLAGRHVLRWNLPAARPTTLVRAHPRLAVDSAREALELAEALALAALVLLPPLDMEVGALLAGDRGGVGWKQSSNVALRSPVGWRTAPAGVEVAPAAEGLACGPRVLLTGFMGAGKTCVGRALAERLGWTFLDTDHLVQQEAGGSIAALFAREGEAGFRERERRAVAWALTQERAVVALGGGSLEDPATRRAVAGAGSAVLLWAPLPVLLARAAGADRPLLDGRWDPAALLEARRAAYLEAADLVFSTASVSPAEVAARIADELRGAGRIP